MRGLCLLVAHEAHHRGQIVMALEQRGMKLPEEVTMKGLWGGWMHGGAATDVTRAGNRGSDG